MLRERSSLDKHSHGLIFLDIYTHFMWYIWTKLLSKKSYMDNNTHSKKYCMDKHGR